MVALLVHRRQALARDSACAYQHFLLPVTLRVNAENLCDLHSGFSEALTKLTRR